jgi:hypothetical protein
MENKVFNTWLVCDYRSGKFRVSKRKPKKMKASEIAIDVKLNIEIPEDPILKAEGHITLSKTQLANMIIESLTDASEEEVK